MYISDEFILIYTHIVELIYIPIHTYLVSLLLYINTYISGELMYIVYTYTHISRDLIYIIMWRICILYGFPCEMDFSHHESPNPARVA